MSDLALYQYVLIALIFVWSGFVRSSLGFGGAVLTLPFLLIIDDKPLVFLPIIAVHLLIFSSLTIWASHKKNGGRKNNGQSSAHISAEKSTVDWPYLKHVLSIMIIPKMIGVLGILTLPSNVLSAMIFCIVTIYSVSYVLNRPFKSQNKIINNLFLVLGGYVSGTSLAAAPLIAAVFAEKVAKDQLRDTLFALWFILVAIKVAAFIYVGVDLQLVHHLWLLPSAFIGHFLGLRVHTYMLNADTARFYKILGSVLLVTSLFGLSTSF